jgi:elongation factor G
MRTYETKNLRDVAFAGQRGSGKTTLCEAMLFDAKMVTRLGSVDDGNSNFDYEPEEIKRTSTIGTALGHIEWAKSKINVVDTPGASDFMYDTEMAMRVVDGAVVVVSATDGVMVNTEKVWNFAVKYGLPKAVFVTKMDQERADFQKVLDELQQGLDRKAVAMQIPIGKEQDFKGVVDLLSNKALSFEDEGRKTVESEVPADLKDAAEEARVALIEMIAESDDALMEKYLEGEDLGAEEIVGALKAAIASGDVIPVLCGSGKNNIGVQPLLNLIKDSFPCPQEGTVIEARKKDEADTTEVRADPESDFSALVFKTAGADIGRLSLMRVVSGKLDADATVYNPGHEAKERFSQLYVLQGKKRDTVSQAMAGDLVAVAKLKETRTGDTLTADGKEQVFVVPAVPDPVTFYAIRPKSKADEDRLGAKLNELTAEDPALSVERDPDFGEMVLGGMGQIHIDTSVEKLKRFGVEVEMSLPRIPYRETITRKVERTEGKHKKQSGGRGQYGICYIEIEPLREDEQTDGKAERRELPYGGGFMFVDKIFGGSIPQTYRPSVEKGILDRMAKGVIAGYPVTDIKVTLLDGKYHDVDSSDYAFQLAGSKGFQAAVKSGNPVLLEPIYEIEIVCPDECMGDIMGDINAKRGRVLGMEAAGKNQVIKARVPLAEIQRYAADLDSLTQGRGSFTMRFGQYEQMPSNLAEKIIAASKTEEEEE